MQASPIAGVVLAALLFLSQDVNASGLVVHEWGTFTSVISATGQMLAGLETEEEAVPTFVHSFPGFAPLNKGLSLPVRGATVKMETPVLYFYSTTPRSVRVDVGFKGGTISQWYPDRRGGEKAPAGPLLDLGTGYTGRAQWQVEVLGPKTAAQINARRDWETPQWPRARIAGANLVRGPHDEVEGFIFYRGLGHFALPLHVACGVDGALTLKNTGRDRMPFVWVYDNSHAEAGAAYDWSGALRPGGTQHVSARVHRTPTTTAALQAALIRAGLSPAEAGALLATWRESYFERPGLRVFWIVPRAFTDSILPMTIDPQPDALVRVLVGRTEILTRKFETELAREFALNGGKRWESDRYFRAYRERARQLGIPVAIAPVAATP